MEEPVRFGVLGVARVFERRLAPAFRAAAGAQLHAVASRSQEKAEAAREKHGAVRAYGDYDALLADPEIEAVYIPLPNDQHATWTLRALAAGKHVLCDKPMALSVADAEAMALAAQQAGLRLMEGFMYRHHPQHALVQEWVRTGRIGAPVHFRGTFTYPAATEHQGIRFNPEQGGGGLLDVGVYPINAARWLLGAEPTAAVGVARQDPTTGVDLHTSAVLAFPGGVTASIVGGFDQAFVSRYELVGRDGVIVAERAFQIGESGVRVVLRAGNDTEEVRAFPHDDHFTREVAHFAACVRDPELPLEPGEDGVAQARAVALLRAHCQRVQ